MCIQISLFEGVDTAKEVDELFTVRNSLSKLIPHWKMIKISLQTLIVVPFVIGNHGVACQSGLQIVKKYKASHGNTVKIPGIYVVLEWRMARRLLVENRFIKKAVYIGLKFVKPRDLSIV